MKDNCKLNTASKRNDCYESPHVKQILPDNSRQTGVPSGHFLQHPSIFSLHSLSLIITTQLPAFENIFYVNVSNAAISSFFKDNL